VDGVFRYALVDAVLGDPREPVASATEGV